MYERQDILCLALGVVGFKGVAFYHQQGIVIVGGYLRGFPCQFIHVDVSVPFCCDNRRLAVHHKQAVYNKYVCKVGILGVSFAYINYY